MVVKDAAAGLLKARSTASNNSGRLRIGGCIGNRGHRPADINGGLACRDLDRARELGAELVVIGLPLLIVALYLALFAACFVLAYVVCALSTGSFQFWHVWGWFRYRG